MASKFLRSSVGLLVATAAIAIPAAGAPVANDCNGHPATIVGTDRAEQLVGTAGDDVIWAGGGNDKVSGGGGRDFLCGAGGADTIEGDRDGDFLYGGDGNDRLDGGSGQDYVDGGAGNDRLVGGPDIDSLVGGPGSDQLRGAKDAPDQAQFVFSPAAVTVDLLAGTAVGDGTDTLFNIDLVVGSQFGDTLLGNNNSNDFIPMMGDDFVDGRGGFDGVENNFLVDPVTVDLGAGTVTGQGNDRLASIEAVGGTVGADVMIGSEGNDSLTGRDGDDRIDGRGGADNLAGSPGADHIDGGPGVDVADGGFDGDICVNAETQISCEEIADPRTDDAEQLRAASTIEPAVDFDGQALSVSAAVALPAGFASDPVGGARWFVASYSDLIGVDAGDLLLVRSVASTDGGRSLVFQQLAGGIPVHRAYLRIWIDETNVLRSLHSDLISVSDPIDLQEPRVDGARAAAIAVNKIDPDRFEVVDDPRLVWFSATVVGETGPPVLAWEVTARLRPQVGDRAELVLVDAMTGALLRRISAEADGDRVGEDFEISRTDEASDDPDSCYAGDNLVEEWGDGATPLVTSPSDDSTFAWTALHLTYHYYYDHFRYDDHAWKSWDGVGDDIQVVTNEEEKANKIGSYSGGVCETIIMSPNNILADWIVHEFTHGVDDHGADLDGEGESGAAQEAFSDIMAALATAGLPPGATADGPRGPRSATDWQIGETATTPANRDLANPARDRYSERVQFLAGTCWGYDNDGFYTVVDTTTTGQPGCPVDTNFRVTCDSSNDDCGEHWNATILGHAAFLATRGGAHRDTGVVVAGIGDEKAEELYLKTLWNDLDGNVGWRSIRNALVARARAYASRGTYGFTWTDVCSVIRAHEAVELGPGDVDCDGLDDAADRDADNDGRPDRDDRDDDDDYVVDTEDNCPTVPNLSQVDTDEDGTGDACEPDLDADGTVNPLDNCPNVANPTQANADGDAFGDACDDSDRDGLTDLEELTIGTSPTNRDTDGDNLSDRDEVRRGTNPRDADSDHDGARDGDEVTRLHTDPLDSDSDDDGDRDAADNCPTTANGTQVDTDLDRHGDACDVCPQTSDPLQEDLDADGVGDACDSDRDGDDVDNGKDDCPEHSDRFQVDLDDDGVGLVCDFDEIGLFTADENGAFAFIAQFDASGRVRIPFVPCIRACDPNGVETRISVALETSLPVTARVVDNFGRADTERNTNEALLQFAVRPDAHPEVKDATRQYFIEIDAGTQSEAPESVEVRLRLIGP